MHTEAVQRDVHAVECGDDVDHVGDLSSTANASQSHQRFYGQVDAGVAVHVHMGHVLSEIPTLQDGNPRYKRKLGTEMEHRVDGEVLVIKDSEPRRGSSGWLTWHVLRCAEHRRCGDLVQDAGDFDAEQIGIVAPVAIPGDFCIGATVQNSRPKGFRVSVPTSPVLLHRAERYAHRHRKTLPAIVHDGHRGTQWVPILARGLVVPWSTRAVPSRTGRG